MTRIAEHDVTASLIAKAVLNRKLLFVSVFLCLSTLSAAVIYSLTPLYESVTLLIGGQPELERMPHDGRRAADSGISVAAIAESTDVIQAAIRAVGRERLAPRAEEGSPSPLKSLVAALLGGRPRGARGDTIDDRVLAQVARTVRVKNELNSDLVRVSFRHPDPGVAADFTNAIAQTLLDRQADVFGKPGAAAFFAERSRHFASEAARLSSELVAYSTSTGIYGIDEQRQLLLRRRSELATSLSQVRASIIDRTAQKVAIGRQLRRLAPVARSPFVSTIVAHLADDPDGKPTPNARTPEELQTADAPLLMVKIYQDSMAALFRLDSELSGSDKVREQYIAEISQLTNELDRLASGEKTFDNLKRLIAAAEANATLYEKRMIEEQINFDSRASKIHSVKVIQRASRALSPVFPNYTTLLGLMVAVSFVVAFVLAAYSGYREALIQHRIVH